MRFSHDWHLYGLCALAAVMSAAGVIALDEQGVLRIATKPETIAAVETREAALKRQDRLPSAMAQPRSLVETNSVTPPGTVSLEELPLDTPPQANGLPTQEAPAGEWLTTELSESENPDWWPADVQREAPPSLTGPRVATAPPSIPAIPRLPWRSPPAAHAPLGKRLTERLSEISPAAELRLTAKFTDAKVAWPPSEIALVGIKDEKVLELLARANGGAWTSIHRYPVLAASGKIGPKLRKGDYQVPEGVYGISFLNPDSRYHVSLRVNYPNSFDRQMAEKDGRKDLGGDIMIHGKNVSSGCLAVGDAAAEELFVLAASIGVTNIKVVIAPTDLRSKSAPGLEPGHPQWLPKLYSEVQTAMAEFPKPPSTGLLSFFGK